MNFDEQQPDAVLGPGGPFDRHHSGFSPRPEQRQMAQAVSGTLASAGTLLCEAGTGVGKTFAYLVPAVMSDGKVTISTGTRALQDQLYYRDLPVVTKILGHTKKTAVLKGRANYLCLHRLSLAETDIHHREEAGWLQTIRDWSTRTSSGDLSELTAIPEDTALWRRVTSTQENCLGQQCPAFSDCHIVSARRKAQTADILVINHHLLFSDMMLREEGFGELLPGTDAFIIDEAHQLPELASEFFGRSLSNRQLSELGDDVLLEYQKEAGDIPRFPEMVSRYRNRIVSLVRALGAGQGRQPLGTVLRQAKVGALFEDLKHELDALQQELARCADRGRGLDNCWRRAQTLLFTLDSILARNDLEQVAWLETDYRRFRLHSTPLDVAEIFQSSISHYQAAWIFTSATLSVNRDFSHFAAKLGLNNARTCCLDSPFDYSRQACLYLPEGMPEPAAPDYIRTLVDKVVPLFRLTQGRAFFLFTSHRALKLASELLAEAGLDYPLLIQGSAPHAELLERFRQHGHAILLGTGSFWEGVDVKGPALSCVVIDKLPFATPDDPVYQARAEQMSRAGLNPFRDYQLPNAVISLRQGAGRLIRDCHDSGVLVICDSRIRSKSYGRIFLQSLPPMPVVTSLAELRGRFQPDQSVASHADVAGL